MTLCPCRYSPSGAPPRRKLHTWSSIGRHSTGNSAHVTAAATTAVGVGSTVFTLAPTVIRGAYVAAATSSRTLRETGPARLQRRRGTTARTTAAPRAFSPRLLSAVPPRRPGDDDPVTNVNSNIN